MIEEIWVLDYTCIDIPMFRVRWAEKVETDQDNFTRMIIPKKKPVDETRKGKRVSAYKELWVLAKQVTQCFYIVDPLAEDHVIMRRGKRSIVGVDGVVDEEDYNQFDDLDPVVDEAAVCIPPPVPWQRRIETTLPAGNEFPYKRSSHKEERSHTTKRTRRTTNVEK